MKVSSCSRKPSHTGFNFLQLTTTCVDLVSVPSSSSSIYGGCFSYFPNSASTGPVPHYFNHLAHLLQTRIGEEKTFPLQHKVKATLCHGGALRVLRVLRVRLHTRTFKDVKAEVPSSVSAFKPLQLTTCVPLPPNGGCR